MINPRLLLPLLFAIGLFLIGAVPLTASEPVDYTRDVLPILERYCIGCHTEGDPEGGFVMQTHVGLMAGGDSGSAITAGVSGSSRMFLMASGRLEPVMPPEGEPRPDDEELALLAAWIEAGAEGPDGQLPLRRELRVPTITPSAEISRPVTAVAVSPDGRLRAVARFGSVEVRDAEDRLVTEIAEQPGKVNSLNFNRDGSTLLVASGLTGAFGRAAVYDAESGRVLTELLGHQDTLYAAVFSPDEQIVATAGYDSEIILWDVDSATPLRTLSGHNGAIFDLAFSPDGDVLVSGCADETVKVWQVETGARLDTMSQPEGEVHAVAITPDGRYVLACSGDNRLRVWRLESKTRARINPIVATRFIDESPLTGLAITPQGDALVIVSEAGNVKVIDTQNWNQTAVLDPLGEVASDIAIGGNGTTCWISLMDGRVVSRTIPQQTTATVVQRAGRQAPIYMKLQEPLAMNEAAVRDTHPDSRQLPISRGAIVSGAISGAGEVDEYVWHASAGEVWAIDADAVDNSPLDPIVSIVDADGKPVLRVRLQAVRDTYFTFRGKDSNQSGDFRLFAWQELQLNDHLYAAGEVTRLWMHPRGPDSGFNVYPGQGTRWTYFGTTPATHALGEPAYVVRPLQPGEEPAANGLPLFDIYYENDDDPMRMVGKNSRLVFTAPADGQYTIRIADTRGAGSDDHRYRLTLRAAEPDFRASVQAIRKPIPRGGGREFVVSVDRLDGFDGPVTFTLDGLPDGLVANMPLVIEEGQQQAIGTVWADPSTPGWEGTLEPQLTATATLMGRKIERRAGSIGNLELAERAPAIPSIHPLDRDVPENQPWRLTVRRGETVSARLRLHRQQEFTTEVGFGKEYSARNATHGVYVDNIGLNGLLVRQDESEREFFLTADPVAQPGERQFFLTAEIDGGITSFPIIVEVLP